MPSCTHESDLILRRVDIILDAGFKEFYKYCKGQDIPVVIISRYASPARHARARRRSCWYRGVSSGMEPSIRAVLSNLIGDADAGAIDVVSNDVDVRPDGSWSIKYRHPTRCVHGPRASARGRVLTRAAVGSGTTRARRSRRTEHSPASLSYSSSATASPVRLPLPPFPSPPVPAASPAPPLTRPPPLRCAAQTCPLRGTRTCSS